MKKLNFGEAIEALKQGKTVARQGWNGKNMFIYLNKGSIDSSKVKTTSTEPYKSEILDNIEGVDGSLFELGPQGSTTRLPNLNMYTPSGSTVTGWLASQTDILSEDWLIIK